jgi:branched-chain amino acid transport system ATP-binding protein
VASFVPGLSRRGFERLVESRTAAALAAAGVEGIADVPVVTLPTGLRRRVELARALAMRPRLLLLDEVASGLNDAEKRALADLLARLARAAGIPILLVEHDIGFMTALAEDVVVLDSGRVIAHGAPATVLNDPQVVASYLGTRGMAHA